MSWRFGRLMVITDETIQDRFSHEKLAALAAAGGAGIIQYRDKNAGTAEMIDKAVVLKNICAQHGVALIINDRVDVVLAAGADGVHLGQEDLPVAVARKLLGPDKIIGGTAGTVEQAIQAQMDGADYVGFGHIFPTGSKDKPGRPVGLEGLKAVCAAVDLPVVAIGGIDASSAPEVIRAGASAVAVIGAVCGREDPAAAAAEIVRGIQGELNNNPRLDYDTQSGDK